MSLKWWEAGWNTAKPKEPVIDEAAERLGVAYDRIEELENENGKLKNDVLYRDTRLTFANSECRRWEELADVRGREIGRLLRNLREMNVEKYNVRRVMRQIAELSASSLTEVVETPETEYPAEEVSDGIQPAQ